ncbi:gliding motility protein RemB [Namhaeicola litoreus]|uniref:Gliding motility protein RemB n=1 Tax=Namhaeicola litoreus TaxID=1052145 RepID=A0ABW3Y033_9FLAO
MNRLLFAIILLFSSSIFGQIEKPPIYPGCENLDANQTEACFFTSLKNDVISKFNVPEKAIRENYKGKVNVIFVVDNTGKINVLHVTAMYQELEDEVNRIFNTLPKIVPATYNSRNIEKQYLLPISIPLDKAGQEYQVLAKPTPVVSEPFMIEDTQKVEIEDAIQNTSIFPEFQSELNIPFTHIGYDDIIYHLEQNENTHTASKPYLYNEVKPYIDLEAKRNAILKDKETWAGRKLWNEHLFLVKGKNYWFTVNPAFDFQIGKDNSDIDYTYNNTRAIQIQGSLGKKFSFSTSFYESQGRFAQYINETTREYNPIIGASAIVPGRGKAKSFKEGGFDYPVAEAYLSYTPNEFFNFQFGNGKNFIGDGYRTFFLSDVASPYPFFKISTNFWKIKYTNLWMWMSDVRRTTTDDGTNLQKYVAMHHLSWNVTKNFNIGLFEAVITNENSYNGFDVSFFNPIIFYRAVEFSNGGDLSGNVQIGLNMKYKINERISVYNQFLVDEMTVDEVFSGEGYWGNKFAFQLGGKFFDAFKIKNLMLQGEFNWVRPYTFAHGEIPLNSGHYNQPISHLWGGNFWEVAGIARYQKDRWYGDMKIIIGEKGFDFSNSNVTYGGDIYKSYNDRLSDYDNSVAQGNTTNIFITELKAGYVINPVTNLNAFAGFTYRGFSPLESAGIVREDQTTWFTVGVRSDLFNWYFDR